jgi:hypothetical protein
MTHPLRAAMQKARRLFDRYEHPAYPWGIGATMVSLVMTMFGKLGHAAESFFGDSVALVACSAGVLDRALCSRTRALCSRTRDSV